MKRIVIVGSSGHARVVIDVVRNEGRFVLAGLIDPLRRIGEETMGVRILGSEADLPELAERHALGGVIVAIGDNFVRGNVAETIRAICPQLTFVTAIHPSAIIGAEVRIGSGTVVMPGAIVNPCCVIGNNCVLNTGSSLDHDSVMEDCASLAPGSTAGGNCRIGKYAAVGIGATLFNGVSVGEHSVIGGGALVLRAVEPLAVAFGVPARTVRRRKPGDKYL